ncbi:CU044_5270 family protein [Nonomuraea rhizosphaerae]|uniref:CU044_5270 family protein n=1 Tax=Nonomuraea rhizosphaerae TaxID=2665663 RepID=UPI001C5FD0BE|nr:CU044_5270 family protein [Nonomuraea rhizosphaerae]
MDDEIRTFADGAPDVPPYWPEARAKARERLLREAREGRGFRFPRLGWQAVAAFGVTVALVGGVAVVLSGQPGGPGPGVGTSVALTTGELDPRPGQFIVVESDTMYTSESVDGSGHSRWLYRTHRKIWRSADASANGLLLIEGREPKPYPGEALPEQARDWRGSDWMQLASCPGRLAAWRTDYAYLSVLPTDPVILRKRLYERASGGKPGADADKQAFVAAGDLLRETYMPKEQRDALFMAIGGIPGVKAAQNVEDSAGRKGVALGRDSDNGTLEQLIFDPESHLLLGERVTVIAQKDGRPPVGSVLALTAQLNVSVVDKLPDAPNVAADGSCSVEQASASPQPTTVPTPGPTDPQPAPTEAVLTEEPATDEPAAEPAPTEPNITEAPAPVDDAPEPAPMEDSPAGS